MSENKENNFSESKLGKLQKLPVFSVPDNFFDQLETDILNKTLIKHASAPIKKKINWLKIGLYTSSVVAAMMVIGFFISIQIQNSNIKNTSSIHFKSPKSFKNDITTTNQNSRNINTQASAIKSQDSSIAIEKFNLKNENNTILNSNLPDIAQFKTNKDEIKDNGNKNSYQTPKYQTDEPGNNYISTPSIASLNFSSPAANQSAYFTKISNGNAILTGFLGKDTSSTESIRLDADIKNIRARYLWSNGIEKPSQTISKSGNYWLKILNYNGDLIGLDTINVKIINLEKPDLGPDLTICKGTPFELDTKLDNPEYIYSWNISNKKTSKIQLKDLSIGIYKIKVEVRYCGYSTFDELILKVIDCELKFPNVITPNQDGYNDKFVIEGLDDYPGSSLFIIDRNGRHVYDNNNYQNDWSAENLPDGTYFFVLRKADSKHTEYSGTISVIRK